MSDVRVPLDVLYWLMVIPSVIVPLLRNSRRHSAWGVLFAEYPIALFVDIIVRSRHLIVKCNTSTVAQIASLVAVDVMTVSPP